MATLRASPSTASQQSAWPVASGPATQFFTLLPIHKKVQFLPKLTIGDTEFLLDGQPHRILSGALHYFRVHPKLWADRIHKAKLMGLNTIETYAPWNAHEPRRGEWHTSDGLDLGRFLDLIAAEGMHAIVRPGPYICAEWSNGGLPNWLTRDTSVGLRRAEPTYLAALDSYLRKVYEIVAPRQIDVGGPVVLVQIENEYGAYGKDKQYLEHLVHTTRDAGITVALTTVDQPTDQMLSDGNIPGLHMTGSFGARGAERLATLRRHQPSGPLMCMEFWDGWFDSWGTHHHTTSPASAAAELETLLSAGASVNLYMFHGGTNFGVTNGANDKGRYQALTTSYDYDAPLDEAGNPTAKYFAFREVLDRYAVVPIDAPDAGVAAPEFDVALVANRSLFDLVPTIAETTLHHSLPTFDELEFDGVLAVFRTTLSVGGPALLTIDHVRDRCWIYVDDVAIGVLSREAHERSLLLPSAEGELTLVVEDQGRVNYGPRIGEPKGLIGGVRLDGRPVTGWAASPIEIDRIAAISADPGAGAQGSHKSAGPTVARGEFELAGQTDLFLDTSTMGKGFAWLNGFALGRYWRRGPQHTLYVPAPATRVGTNTLVLLELESAAEAAARFVPTPNLGYVDL